MRIMVDTNILISAVVFRSEKMYAVMEYIVSNHELVLPTYVVDELRDVVKRKFPKVVKQLDEFLTKLSFTVAYTPNTTPSGLFEIRDVADAPILYTAIIEGIDVFVTGDKDFHAVEIEKPLIMTIADFQTTYMLR